MSVRLGLLALSGPALYATVSSAKKMENSDALHAPHYPWHFNKPLGTFDHAALRRGFEVYKQVCASCHGLSRVAFRNLVGVTHTAAEAKMLAEEIEFQDGPDENGDMFMRPGKLSDYFPEPYANENAARAANNGAYPPDLSLMTKARHNGSDYLFALLMGYCEPPGGVEIRDGLHYNPYFPGGAIGMARQLFDDMIEYDDGTPATSSQMAKDVTEFLSWAAEPEMTERKLMGLRAMVLMTFAAAATWYIKRHRWTVIKNRKVVYNPMMKN
ncbi:ubiquinol-cytochrome c reductase cytochrome c1 subunit [Fonticula alba]|uniref:Ubiquinol-cytochrome c reductase cytochrome c1 subunit n=1 Tax=Fonticula alba TaxID=691883 RepID=A0A058ZBA1_FONAL|nr:ubiquinol-cytochrome c reductase cytochrome c1 subunit [Fonticula alba]KCV71198.1 ubiquinol-cytochrome c reductase cytochrome c1 subunit [Fonticula alba]|eukprot:XP_009494321.1 ubiquinol-cytochrome c reductase cytochrome c1 subunit [Fonticula alba]